ncbi:hypothetical protein HBB16_00745 [Pseudonocardia sp. MCCB 268]|nr:hypothetical protein [Pseudonocardia cytotoxica]
MVAWLSTSMGTPSPVRSVPVRRRGRRPAGRLTAAGKWKRRAWLTGE